LKKEVFNVEDSNIAGLGSDLDKQCREAAAGTEKAWANAGKKPGMQIWRIEKFKVKASKTPPGTFYNDDSYICLNTYKVKDENGKETDKLAWDIHFWLGETTSQDEAGTAAYKTVELDDFLHQAPVQHREVSGHESAQFLAYFKDCGGIQLLEGGIESGFNHVEPEKFAPRLLHLKGRKNIRVQQVPMEVGSFNAGDVFVLDLGLNIYQWQGSKAGRNEKARAGQLCRALDDERKGKPEVHVFSEKDSDVQEFWTAFGSDSVPEVNPDDGKDAEWEKGTDVKCFHLSDASGEMVFSEMKPEGSKNQFLKSQLNGDDVHIFDSGNEIFVWVGNGASTDEKRSAMKYAMDYIKKNNKDPKLPVTKLMQSQDNNTFNSFFA